MTDDARPCWGLLGGAFDPPHLGHLAVGALALAAGGLERLLAVPCFEHPFAKRMAPWEDRLAMARLAFAHLARAEVSAIESGLPRPSLTLRTLEALRAAHPHVRWRLVIGSDTRAERASWYRFDEVMRLAEPLVVGRSGHGAGDLDFAVPDVSSTEIRRRLAAAQDVRGWLDPAVLAYVQAHRLYGAGPGEPRP
jgi:nicotinate-nucleotide adenylyltransferase